MDESDRQWLAGLVEGEGYFGLNRKGKYVYSAFGMNMVDFDIMERAARLLDLPLYKSEKRQKGWKPQYRLATYSSNALRVASLVQPFMYSRRYAKISEIFGIEHATKQRGIDYYVGLIEGEGSFYLSKDNTPYFGLKMTDKDVVIGTKVFFNNIGRIYTEDNKHKRRKTAYKWNVCPIKDSLTIMDMCYYGLGERRRATLDKLYEVVKDKET